MGWNGSEVKRAEGRDRAEAEKAAARTVRSGALRKWCLLAGLAVVLGCGLAVWLRFGRGGTPASEPGETTKPSQIAEVAPAAAPTNDVPKKPVRLTAKGTPIPDDVQLDSHGVYRHPNGQMWVDRKAQVVNKPNAPRLLFRHTSENQIAVMLRLDPSHMLPMLVGRRPRFDAKFVEDFKKSLNDEPADESQDTPEEALLRKSVKETKADLKARMEAGEDIAKVMNDTQDELDRLCQYRADLQAEVDKALYDSKLTDDEVRDYVKAANAMLEKQGISKFTMPSFVNRQARIMMHNERKAKLEREEKLRKQKDEEKGDRK